MHLLVKPHANVPFNLAVYQGPPAHITKSTCPPHYASPRAQIPALFVSPMNHCAPQLSSPLDAVPSPVLSPVYRCLPRDISPQISTPGHAISPPCYIKFSNYHHKMRHHLSIYFCLTSKFFIYHTVDYRINGGSMKNRRPIVHPVVDFDNVG